MTAALQTYARKTRTPIDALAFRTNVREYLRDGVTGPPDDGVHIHGLFLQGARWDYTRKTVEDSEPGKAIVDCPVIWLEPVDINENLETGCFSCPLYKTSTRRGELSTTGHSTNFIGYLQLPTERSADYWVRRGAALLCMTDD